MKKIISIMLVLVMLASLFVGCNGSDDKNTDSSQQGTQQNNNNGSNNDSEKLTWDKIISNAENAMKNVPYEMTASYTYTADDAELNDLFASMNASNKSLVNGNEFKTDLSVMGISIEIVLFDDVLYYSAEDLNEFLKAPVTEADYEKIYSSYVDTDLGVSEDDFEKVEMTESEGKYVITFTDVKAEMYNDILEDTMGSAQGVTLSNLGYVITVEDGKITAVTLNVDMEMSAEGESYNVHMVAECTYKYTDLGTITAPQNADAYTDSTLDEIIG